MPLIGVIAVLLVASSILLIFLSQPQAITVSITSFETQFSYSGPSAGYLSIISQVPDANSVSGIGPSQLQYLLSLVVQNNASTTHRITGFGTIGTGFKVVSSNLPSLPVTIPASGGTVSFTLVIQYRNMVPYKGPLTVQLQSA